jgi:hypothetical protein
VGDLVESAKPPPLWRFILAATVVVAVIGSIAFARRTGPPNLRISGAVSGTPTPTAERPDAAAGTPPSQAAFIGSGSWTMSSLPSCFQERERLRGTVAQLRAKFPPTSQRVRPPGVVMSGDCVVAVRDHELLITRGADQLRVPSEAYLYREGSRLTLVYIHGTRAEIRRY